MDSVEFEESSYSPKELDVDFRKEESSFLYLLDSTDKRNFLILG